MKAVFCIALLATGLVVSAQVQFPTPTFRTGVNAVVLDVRVVDRDGRFIRDLDKDDFQVFEDGREQPITTFDLIDLPAVIPSARSVAFVGLPSDVSSNVGFSDGRLYVIVLDDLMGHTPQVMPDQSSNPAFGSPSLALDPAAVARELIFHMAEGDRAAVVTTGGRRDMAQEFTNDRARLLATVDRFVANQGQPDWFGRSLEDAMQSLKEIANWLANIEGRRKAIVLISQRLGSISADITLTNLSKAAGLQDLMTPFHMRNLIEATSRGNVSIYTLSPVIRGAELPLLDEYILAGADRTPRRVTIAQATGGFSRGGSFEGVFERIASENGSYYLIGFTSSAKEDGQFHRLEVRTRRPELGVRTRAGYVANPKPELKKAMIPKETPLPLAEALQSPASISGLPMSMSAVPYRGTGSKALLSIVVNVESDPSGATRVRPDGKPIEIAIAAAQVNGKAADVRRISIYGNGGTVVSRLDLKPGRYHMRTAGLDTADMRRGSLLADIDVPDFSRGSLTMSGIVLTSAGTPPTQVGGADQRWKNQLGVPPTTRRVFAADDELRDYVEVYDNTKPRASEIDVLTTVRDESGDVEFSRRQHSGVTPARGKLAAHPIQTTIPLDGMKAGAHLLTIEVERSGESGTKVSRTIPFSVN